MSRQITPSTTIENLKKEAKRWLKALRAHDADARARFERAYPDAPATASLREVQHALAREFGVPGWSALKIRLDQPPRLRHYEAVAAALITAYRTGDDSAMRIVWDYFGHMRAWEGMRRYVRLDLGKTEVAGSPEDDSITIAEAQLLVARAQGFDSWKALADYATSLPDKPTIAAKSVAANAGDDADPRDVAVRSHDWDDIFVAMRERGLIGLHANGQMTDTLLERFSQLDQITSLDLDGSRALTDNGLHHLARLPRLHRLNVSGCTGITDRGLAVLQKLPALESLSLAWTRVTDAGAAQLTACDNLRAVDLSGTQTGDGAIRALTGKQALHDFRSGNLVSDAGIARLHDLPVFKSWQGGERRMSLLSFDAAPNFLMLRGTFTDRGLAQLVGLDGLFALNIDSPHLAVTSAGLAPLVKLPHLEVLAFDATDESMPYIAALPHLRFVLCQDTIAGDDGFVALSKSPTIEYIWGRRCYNLQRRGFMALAEMPALQSLSVSCRNVDDDGLSTLPQFPALRELMPIDVPDDGYRHVGKCEQLESLVLMYCRETTDVATEHIARLPKLKKYFASYTRITDRTPEILSRMPSLEEIIFDSCAGLTNRGIAALARLPRLRTLRVSGMPNVTSEVVAAFEPLVSVSYAP